MACLQTYQQSQQDWEGDGGMMMMMMMMVAMMMMMVVMMMMTLRLDPLRSKGLRLVPELRLIGGYF